MRACLPLLALASLACNGDTTIATWNGPPAVAITGPPTGSIYDEGDVVELRGRVVDDGPAADLIVQWTSDISGILLDSVPVDADGTVAYTTSNLEPGNHLISLVATDREAERVEASITITVNDLPDPPTLEIIRPGSGEGADEGVPFEFVAKVSDAQDDPEDLVVEIFSDLDGRICSPVPDSIGEARCKQELDPGTHRITFQVTDSEDFSVMDERYLTVRALEDIDNDGDGWTDNQGDCDDDNNTIFPGATEVYNDIDDDCDGIIDEGTVGYDDDGDGWSEIDGDCDDTDDRTYPYAKEIADGEDNDCDGVIDEGTTAYDDDGDGYSEDDGDCNDANASISPAATETCDSVDNDCDGSTDEANASGCSSYYADSDSDLYGDASTTSCLCASTSTYKVTNSTDCYDSNSSANPAQTSYFSVQRGDGSYDYNCDSVESKYYTTSYSCSWNVVSCSTTQGWNSTTPSCGTSGTWVTSCSWDWFGCSTSTTSRTQTCK